MVKLESKIKGRKADREYQRKKRADGFIDYVYKMKDWYDLHPYAWRAHHAVHKAVKEGKIIKGECEFKDWTCSATIQAHHEDYEKPLEVRWLCASHHKKVDLGLILLTKIKRLC